MQETDLVYLICINKIIQFYFQELQRLLISKLRLILKSQICQYRVHCLHKEIV